MIAEITILDIVHWIYLNQRGRAFKDWNCDQIREHLEECIEENTMLVSQDKKGYINGVITATIYEPNVLHIENILTTGHGVVKEFLAYFKSKYPGYELEAMRRGKIKSYKTKTLVTKLEHYGQRSEAC